MLLLRQTGVFTPTKLFSIDRVFRNETLDATHLAEFHQVAAIAFLFILFFFPSPPFFYCYFFTWNFFPQEKKWQKKKAILGPNFLKIKIHLNSTKSALKQHFFAITLYLKILPTAKKVTRFSSNPTNNTEKLNNFQ